MLHTDTGYLFREQNTHFIIPQPTYLCTCVDVIGGTGREGRLRPLQTIASDLTHGHEVDMPTAEATDPPQPTVPPAQDASVATVQRMQQADMGAKGKRVLRRRAKLAAEGTRRETYCVQRKEWEMEERVPVLGGRWHEVVIKFEGANQINLHQEAAGLLPTPRHPCFQSLSMLNAREIQVVAWAFSARRVNGLV